MEISTSVAIIAGLLFIMTLCGIAIAVKAVKALSEAQRLLESTRLQMAPVIHDVTQIVADAQSIVRAVDREMDKVGDSLAAIRDTTRNVRDFELMIQKRIERPLLDITAVLSALVKGGRVFLNSFLRR